VTKEISAAPEAEDVELKIGAHVLVQLGRELVTDVEQAILECVKNAYDADAPGCLIEISTSEQDRLVERSTAAKLQRFSEGSESVQVTMTDRDGRPLLEMVELEPNEEVQRHLTYTGRITIEDKGDGLTPDQLKTSWLVISRSKKRSVPGLQKKKTAKGRTPLGDKGLGRLGSMKLGDILRIETATSKDVAISSAQFRWADCENADTIDEIPVFLDSHPNTKGFKGTRVSVLGLKDLGEWQRKNRIFEITQSLAKLISPFEATSTFPVSLKLDGTPYSLVSVTDEALSRAVAKFTFEWKADPENPDKNVLVARAYLRQRLLAAERSNDNKERAKRVFGDDRGAALTEYLKTYRRLKAFDQIDFDLTGTWFVQIERTFRWEDLRPNEATDDSIQDPGAFSGAFYFFHLDDLKSDDGQPPSAAAAAGIEVNGKLIKAMSGISILRDGFRVRSQGDWLEISSGMTSGSTYNMRVENTVGYFALTGEHNYRLTEKSDREGFVEDASYRGFLAIARQCRNFANSAILGTRRGLDDYYSELTKRDQHPSSAKLNPIDAVERDTRATEEAKEEAERVANQLQADLLTLEKSGVGAETSSLAISAISRAAKAMDAVRDKLKTSPHAAANVKRLRQEFEDKSDQAISLYESAAVGLSARGLAHELRTHLSEIRHRTAALEREAGLVGGATIMPHLRAIRSSCSAISNAAALIDPMLPRSRTVKETLSLKTVLEEYRAARAMAFDRAGVEFAITGDSVTVRMNRPRLAQVIDNLVRNSLYWLKRGEDVEKIARPKKIEIELTPFGFVASDSGPGVDPRYEESLFDIFMTAKPDPNAGQGLGLFIITQLLAVDGCEVSLLSDRNEDGRRYRFSVNLSSVIAKG
jgi:signal transduction histidine kinase